MRLAISNIAWPVGADAEAAPLLHVHGVEGVELALTKVWPEPLDAALAEVRAYRDKWEQQGVRIAALQALLFGKPQLTLFGTEAVRQQMRQYLAGMIERAGQLGAQALVFGSPKNRQRGERSPAEALALAVPFFRELGRIAHRNGVSFCIEPNPPAYGCDFVTTVAEAIELVDAVAEEGFALHLDTAAMTLAGEPLAASIASAGERCHHFHVSAPYLAEVGEGTVRHEESARALCGRDYQGWVSIEMSEARDVARSPDHATPAWPAAVERALAFVQTVYGTGERHVRA